MNKDYLQVSIRCAIHAGNEILDVYGTEFNVEHKDDKSPLTLADKRSNAVIVSALTPFGIPVLSEEGRDIPYGERKSWTTFWLVDPLDGTKEFVKRNGEFTVNIALIENGRPIMGVIYVPVKKLLYFCAKDIGAYLYALTDADTPESLTLSGLMAKAGKLPLSPPPETYDEKRPYTIVGSRSHATPELEAFVEKKRAEFPHVEFISAGSSLKLCLVAEGKADIYPRLGPTMEWDTGAGQAIAECSGMTVIQADTGLPLVYNKENLLNPYFIVQRKE